MKSRQATGSTFERNKYKTIFAILTVFLILVLVVAEFGLRTFAGLGNPVLYDSNPFYGYRPIPNQHLKRFGGTPIDINNLGLRADEDWDTTTQSKILFLGDSVTYGGSYISNADLFSTVVGKELGNVKTGNAGVNAWGVENIYGLVVEAGFQPADHYVTTLIEGDFYRGLSRVQGQPFWCKKPKLAFQELGYYFLLTLNDGRYLDWRSFADENTVRAVVRKAVAKLKDLDSALKSKGKTHSIFISPNSDQLLKGAEMDGIVQEELRAANVAVTYLLEDFKTVDSGVFSREKIYRDGVHLESGGHRLWGEKMAARLKGVL